jgi:hypothetical protein
MPELTLTIPDDIYASLTSAAEHDFRTESQEAIYLLQQSLLVRGVANPQALRELRNQLRELSLQAGQPSLRDIADNVGGMSHTTVWNAFAVTSPLPKWAVVSGIVEYLGGNKKTFLDLWRLAAGRPSS